MAQITRIANKTKFETGDVPSQTDFVDLLDSVFMFASDTLENIGQGTNRKWVTPAQITAWDAKTSVGHVHSITNVTGLTSAMDAKQDKHAVAYLDESAVIAVGTILFVEFPKFHAELPVTGCKIDIGDISAGLGADQFTAILRNSNGSPVNVQILPSHVNTGHDTNFQINTAGTNVSVGAGEMLVIECSVVPDGASGNVLVGRIESKPM